MLPNLLKEYLDYEGYFRETVFGSFKKRVAGMSSNSDDIVLHATVRSFFNCLRYFFVILRTTIESILEGIPFLRKVSIS